MSVVKHPIGGTGKILQIVQSTNSTPTTIASVTRANTGLSASITPSSASSKILVMVSQPTTLFRFGDAIKGYVYLMRDATDIVPSEQAPGFTFSGSSLAEAYSLWTYSYLDSPATTSTITYKTQGRVSTVANSGVIYFQLQGVNAPSTIILMEIGG